MQSTYDLYTRALAKQSKAELARRTGVHVTTWTRVEQEHHLPPTVAGKVAIAMDENPRDWITLAHIEAVEKKNPIEAKTLRKACRYLYLSTISATRRVVGQRVRRTQHR